MASYLLQFGFFSSAVVVFNNLLDIGTGDFLDIGTGDFLEIA